MRAFRDSLDRDEEDEAALCLVHDRGGKVEFDLGALYASSVDPLDRITGARVLAQLGCGDRTFVPESLEILIPLLTDPAPRVAKEAAYALGHRKDSRAIPFVLPLAKSPDPLLRFAAVFALSCHEDERAIAELIQLAADPDLGVRDWAAFGLGTQCDFDSPALRDALAALLRDENDEIRGEAMIGLAKRRDPRALGAIGEELCGTFGGSWCLEAAELLAVQDLFPLLVSLQQRVPEPDRVKFAADFSRAMEACRPKHFPDAKSA